MTELSISLLGAYAIHVDGELVTNLIYDQIRALLAYLVLERDPHPREQLAGLLWPESSDAAARRNLRTALYRLRSLINDADADPPRLLVTRDTLQLNPAADIQVDVHAFTEQLEAIRHHNHDRLEACAACLARLTQAAALYRNDLLPAFRLDSAEFEIWLVTRREALHRQALDALDRLADAQLARGAHDLALDYARRQIELEPWRESAHRQAMEALALSGQRAAAIAQYEVCRTTLETELAIEPEEATIELHAQIRRGELATAPAEASKARPPSIPIAASTPVAASAGLVHAEIAPMMPGPAPGTRVVPPPNAETPPTRERRTTTLLSAVLTGAESLLASAGLEVWGETLGGILARLCTEVERYGGTVLQTREAGLVAVFGAIVAHEDDAERAILAALAMRNAVTGEPGPRTGEALGRTGEDLGPAPLALSVGVTTDQAVVLAGAAGTATVHAAARSQMDAVHAQVPPGAIWVTEVTYRRVEPRFTWAWLGEALGATPGADRAPVRLYRPVAPIPGLPAEHDVGGLRSPLVGRDAELKALTDAVAAVTAGIGGLVTLVGEPGIGKSRLVAEACAASTTLPISVRWVEGRWLSYTEGMAYHGWQDLLRRLLALPDACTESTCVMLEDQVAALCPEQVPTLVPYLGRLLALPQDAATKAHLDSLVAAGLLQGALFRAVTDLLACAARQQPLVLVLEDIHWADAASLALLEHILPLTDQLPLLLVAVLRPERAHACWRIREAAMRDYTHRHTDLELPPLSADESAALVRHLLAAAQSAAAGQAGAAALPGDAALPRHADIPRLLHARAEGNPFFTAELVWAFLETGDAQPAAAEVGGLPPGTALPHAILGVLMARIDKLPTAARQVLQLAAVVGRVFPYAVLGEILTGLQAGDASVTVQRSALDEALLRLVRAQMIREGVPEGPANSASRQPVSRTYIFEHQLTLEAAYSSLLRRKRSVLHRRVAEALERLYPDEVETRLGVLAQHWEQAGDTLRAVAYLRRAGEQAAAQYANQAALGYLTRALDLLPEHDLETRYALLLARETLNGREGAYEAQAQDLRRLRQIAQHLGRPKEQAVVAIREGWWAFARHQTTVRALAEEAIAASERAGDASTQAQAHLLMVASYRAQDRTADAEPHVEQALNLAWEARLPSIEIDALSQLAALRMRDGNRAEARTHLKTALQLSRDLQDRGREEEVLLGLTELAGRDVDMDALRTYGEAALNICRETGHRSMESHAHALLSFADFWNGSYAPALLHLESARTLSQAMAQPGQIRSVRIESAHVLRQVGAHNQALVTLRELELIDPPMPVFFATWAGVERAQIALQTGDLALAAQVAREIIGSSSTDLAPNNSEWLPTLHQMAHVILGKSLVGQGDFAAALDVFEQASDIVLRTDSTVTKMEARAGIAEVLLRQGNIAAAMGEIEELLDFVATQPLIYVLEPLNIFLVCYRVLDAVGDPRAEDVLRQGYEALMRNAATIDDPDLHRSYLENVPAHRDLLAAARAAGIADGQS